MSFSLFDNQIYDESQSPTHKMRAIRKGNKVELLQVFQSGYVIEGPIIAYKKYLQKMEEFRSLKLAFWTSKKDQEHYKLLGWVY
jgi:hypothetical protein